ncbi:MAG: hydrogenase maturation nickel metallochaperone HypA [Candidatus Nanohaloarchaeota archaeon QJJ-7]|nr:hydrogenase maturation nickel metallochaperone HypA [Candidatus Nanohaloarchaeota archaeon QJJ-7]
MQETDLVMNLMRELEQRQCNGHAKVKLGTALADPAKFQDIFSNFSRGTYFESLNLEIETVDPVISCSCGYRASPRSPEELSICPVCGGEPELEQGIEFEILEP